MFCVFILHQKNPMMHHQTKITHKCLFTHNLLTRWNPGLFSWIDGWLVAGIEERSSKTESLFYFLSHLLPPSGRVIICSACHCHIDKDVTPSHFDFETSTTQAELCLSNWWSALFSQSSSLFLAAASISLERSCSSLHLCHQEGKMQCLKPR